MAIHTHSRKPRSKQPRKGTTKGDQPITRLEPRRLGWSGLADGIIERAMDLGAGAILPHARV
jgi:hypothetical protein